MALCALILFPWLDLEACSGQDYSLLVSSYALKAMLNKTEILISLCLELFPSNLEIINIIET